MSSDSCLEFFFNECHLSSLDDGLIFCCQCYFVKNGRLFNYPLVHFN
jgi:hypothetical protein